MSIRIGNDLVKTFLYILQGHYYNDFCFVFIYLVNQFIQCISSEYLLICDGHREKLKATTTIQEHRLKEETFLK